MLPLDERVFQRINAELVGRPDVMQGRTSPTQSQDMDCTTENVFLNIKNKSKTIAADVVFGDDGGNGAIIVQSGRFGGRGMYIKDGIPAYGHIFPGLERYSSIATQKLSAGEHTIKFEFDHEGDGMGKGGSGTLYVDGKKVADGRIDRTQAVISFPTRCQMSVWNSRRQ